MQRLKSHQFIRPALWSKYENSMQISPMGRLNHMILERREIVFGDFGFYVARDFGFLGLRGR